MRALARDPSSRFPSARTFADALRPFAHSPLDFEATRRDDTMTVSGGVPSLARAAPRRLVRALGVATFAGASAIVIAFGASLQRGAKSESTEPHSATDPLRTASPATSRKHVEDSASPPSVAAATASSTATAVATPAVARTAAPTQCRCSAIESTLPSTSLNHAIREPPGAVQMPDGS